MSIKSTAIAVCPQFMIILFKRLKTSSIGYRLMHGAFWSLTGTVITRGLLLVSSIFVARILGKHGFGELGIIQSTVGMFGVFAGFGLGLTSAKYIAQYSGKDPDKAGRIMTLSGIVAMFTGGGAAVLLFIFAPWIAAQTLAAPNLADELRISGLLLIFSALNGSQTGALAGFEAFREIATANFYAGLISFPLIVFGAYAGGLQGAIWGLVANMVLNWLLNHLALRKKAALNNVPFSFRGCRKELNILWKFSLPAALSGAMVGPANWACNAMLVNQPNGYAEMGILGAANHWRAMIVFLPAALGRILLPILSELHENQDYGNYRRVIWYNVIVNSVVGFAIALPICILAPLIMTSYGEEFREGFWTLIALTISAVFYAANSVVGQAIASAGVMWWGFIFNCMWAATLIAVSAELVPTLGALGIGLANLAACFLHTLWQSLYMQKYVVNSR